jgi:hypothetical protein
MKIVINTKYGGYNLSALAIQELAKLKNKKCYFFKINGINYIPIKIEETENTNLWVALSVPNPELYKLNERDKNGLYKSANKRYKLISFDDIYNNRTDKDLIKVIEKLGDKANGKYAKLKIIRIPNNVKYTIDEYDGIETVSEVHRSWS